MQRIDQDRENPIAGCGGHEGHEAASFLAENFPVAKARVHSRNTLVQKCNVLVARMLRGLESELRVDGTARIDDRTERGVRELKME